MIDRSDFDERLTHLAAVLGARLTPERTNAYYATLHREFNAQSWAATVSRAALECERFPPPKTLLALRGGEARILHTCELCEGQSGWVPAKELTVKGGLGGRQQGGKRLAMQPCPNRMDARAAGWYSDKADGHHWSIEDEYESARASARALTRDEAARLLRLIDPESKLGVTR